MPKTASPKPRNKPIPAPPAPAKRPASGGKSATPRPAGARKAAPAPKAAAASPKRNRGKVALGLFGFLILAFICLVGFLDGYGQRDRARKADAIVVLGARVGTDGIAGQVLRGRTMQAVKLYKKGIAPKIIFTGGVGAHRISEARAAAAYARKNGVPSRAIVLESKSTSTWENARFTAWICKDHGWKSVVLVSDPYHLWRARRDFQQVGLKPYVSPTKEWQDKYPTRRLWAATREAVLVLRDVFLRPVAV